MAKISDTLLERRKLIQAFTNLKDYPVIAVCAPAGYGKTTAVLQWLKKDKRAKAIFSVDEYDNNITSFCERFCTALLTCQPQNRTLSETISHPSFRKAPDEFAIQAVSALSKRKHAVLVIDDLHCLHNHNKALMQLLLVLIKRLPKNFQVVLISRYDMPIGLAELWLKRQAARISAEQFLFSDNDIKALYTKCGNHITALQAKNINRQVNGWAMGVSAVLLSGKEIFGVTYEYLADFLQTSVWEQWDDETRNFMLRTSALRELTPALCEVMTGAPRSAELLKELVQKGTFITQSQDGVYRYHDLFQRFLTRKAEACGKGFIMSLLEIEGTYYLEQGDFYSAVDCFIRCENHDGIAKSFEYMRDSGIANFSAGRFLPLFSQPVVKDAVKKYPHLLYFMAFSSLAEGRLDDTVFFMDEYYKKCSKGAEGGALHTYNNIYMLFLDFRVSAAQLPGMVVVPEDTANIIVQKWMVSMHMPLIHRGVRDYSIEIRHDAADFIKNELLSKTGWAYGDVAPLLFELISVGLLYEQGNLERAHIHALKVNAMVKEYLLIDLKLCAKYILVHILDAVGEAAEASAVMQSVLASIEEDKAYQLSPNYNAFALRRKIAQGDATAAEHWIDEQIRRPLTFWGLYIAFTTGRALIATGKYNAAIILLSKILEMSHAFDRRHDIIEANILLAIACWRKKRSFQNEALDYLEAACSNAYPYGYVQMFVNEGQALSSMMYKLPKRIEQRENADMACLSFVRALYLKIRNNTDSLPSEANPGKPIKFTDKQKTILNLLYDGKTQKEITKILGIKQSTLRSHLNSIYNKLDVANTLDAVKKINDMKLLE